MSLGKSAENKLMGHWSLPGGQSFPDLSVDQNPQEGLSAHALLASPPVPVFSGSGVELENLHFYEVPGDGKCCCFRNRILRTTDLRILESIFSSLWNFKGLFSLTHSSL